MDLVLDIMLALLGCTVIITVYLLPMIIADFRKHKDKFAITVLNIVAGWTIIAWFGALVWSFVDTHKKKVDYGPYY